MKMIGNVSDWLSYAGGALIKVADSAGSTVLLNPYMMNGIAHHYHSSQSTFMFMRIGVILCFYSIFFYEIPLSKHNCPRWDVALFRVTSGAILTNCLPMPHKMDARLIMIDV